jgi:choline dehydrogenase-like flavoprotein
MRFAGEYYIELFGGRRMPDVETFSAASLADEKPIFGQVLRDRLRNDFGSTIYLGAHGGMIPNADSRCEIDPDVKDRWGIPVLRFYWKWGPQELEQARHATATMREMISAMGGRVNSAPEPTLINGGEAFHEVGTARMGSKPSDSVLNSFGHAWDVRNLYVADGAPFAGHACKNPTDTIMALAWRASDHLVESFARKDL